MDHYFLGGGGGGMDISSMQSIFFAVGVFANNFFAPASFCKQFFCPSGCCGFHYKRTEKELFIWAFAFPFLYLFLQIFLVTHQKALFYQSFVNVTLDRCLGRIKSLLDLGGAVLLRYISFSTKIFRCLLTSLTFLALLITSSLILLTSCLSIH